MSDYKPNEVKSPGDMLQDTLEDMEIEYDEFHPRLSIDRSEFYNFLQGDYRLTVGLAKELEKWTNIPSWLWERREKQYYKHLKRLEKSQD